MSKAQKGDNVEVMYKGTLDDGTVFDQSKENEPLSFKIGEGSIIPGFENAVVGMEEGEKKNLKIEADKAYGQYDDEKNIEVSRDKVPDNIEPEKGMRLQVQDGNGNIVPVTIADTSDKSITLDANHPLAGKDLIFDIELSKIN